MTAARLVGWFVLAVALPAAAAPDDVLGLAWTAPVGCPDLSSMRPRIEARLGVSLDRVSFGDLHVTIERDGDLLVAHVAIDGDVRTLRSASCDELSDAVAVIVARMARARVARSEPRIVVAAEPVVAAARPPAATTIGARLATAADLGAMPRLGMLGEVDAFVRRDALDLELGYAHWVDAAASGASAADTLHVGLSAVALRLRWRPVTWSEAWLVGDAGTMAASGMSPADDRSLTSRWVAVGAGGGVRWPLGRAIAIFGSLEALDALERPRFELASGASLYEPARVSARISVGCEVHWP